MDSGAVVRTLGSILISAEQNDELDLIGGSANAALGTAAGASLTAANVDKVTEAFVAAADGTRALPAAIRQKSLKS